MAFVSSNSNNNSNTNEVDNTAFGVSTAHTQSNPTSGDNLSDAVIYAFLARSSSSSDFKVDSCSKSCITAYATLKEQYDSLSSNYIKSQFNLVSYKAGLESVEARLAHYKKNEIVFEESINVLKLEVKLRDTALVENKKKLEKAKKRDELKLTLENFSCSRKLWNFMARKPDLTFMDEIVESENLDVTTVVTPSNVKAVKNKGVSNII
ncbi:hypothetical protein Tco_0440127 [Tanacetum coccineum]